MRPEVGLCLELVHKHVARPLLSQAGGDVDVVLGVGDGRCFHLDHFGPESSQKVHLFAGLEGKVITVSVLFGDAVCQQQTDRPFTEQATSWGRSQNTPTISSTPILKTDFATTLATSAQSYPAATSAASRVERQIDTRATNRKTSSSSSVWHLESLTWSSGMTMTQR